MITATGSTRLRWVMATLSLCLLLSYTPLMAQPAATPATPPQLQGQDAFTQLQSLHEMAPARQLGQPGNDAIDRYVRDHFESVVEKQNARFGTQRVEQARAAVVAADEADAQFTQARDGRLNYSEAGEAMQSPLWQRMLFEAPGTLVSSLIVLAVVLLVAWRLQKRFSLVIGAAAAVALACGVYLMAAMVTTSAEKAEQGQKTVAGGGVVDAAANKLFNAAKAAFDADMKAGNAFAGMWRSGRVEYETVAFIPGEAWLSVGGNKKVRVFTLAPNLVEPANLPAEGFTGPMVYVGNGGPTELSGQKLQDAVVVIEFDSARRWLSAVQLGAQAIIVLEPDAGHETTFTEAAQKMSVAPLSVPRFYLRRSDLLTALGSGWREALRSQPRAELTQKPSRWEPRTVAADWLFVPAAEGVVADPGKQLVHVQAYKDSLSIVPELSPGAGSAANLVLMMRLIERYREQLPARPILFSVVNDHTNALLGEQNFAHAAFAPSAAILAELSEVEAQLARERFHADIYKNGPNHDLIEKLRDWSLYVAERSVTVKDVLKDRLTQLRNEYRGEATEIFFDINQDARLPEAKRQFTPAFVESQQAIRKELNLQAIQVDGVLRLFNRFGKRTVLADLTQGQRDTLNAAFDYVHKTAVTNIEVLEDDRHRLLSSLRLRRQFIALTQTPDAAATPLTSADQVQAIRLRPLPTLTALTLDLSFGSDTAGFFHWDSLGGDTDEVNANSRVSTLARTTIQLANKYSARTGQPDRLADTIRGGGGLPWSAHLGGKLALAAKPLHAFQIPALTLTSVRDMRPFDFTPQDVPARISRKNFDALMSFAEGYLPELISLPELANITRTVGLATPLSAEIRLMKLDEFTVESPKLILPYSLLVIQPAGQILPNNAPMLGQVRPYAVLSTNGRAAAMLRGSMWRGAGVSPFRYDDDFRAVQFAGDMGDGQKRFASTVNAGPAIPYVAASVIGVELVKIDLLGLSEPLQLTPVATITLIDALQESTPKNYSSIGVPAKVGYLIPLSTDGAASIFLAPDTRFKIRIGSGIAINADAEHDQGIGFPSDVGRLSNLTLTSAKDMWLLTEGRLGLLQDKGVKNDTALFFNGQAKELIQSADRARDAGRNDQLMINAEEAQGLSFQAYTRALGTINDLIKAVVIFLALIIPFCIFFTKLISPYTDVNRNLVFFGVVFAVMALLLRFVHPAFEIARTPEVVILAFVILGLAGFVASVLIGRFNSLMTQAVGESLQAESVEAPQGRLAGVAFVVGVNNMKRRRIRTTLTCVTVVLVTFTMLSVISVGQDVEPTTIRTGEDPAYDGFLYARPGLTPCDAVQVARLRAHYEGKAIVVARAWAQRLGEYGEYLGYEVVPEKPESGAAVSSLTAKVLVGMEPAEDGFVKKLPVVAGRWISSPSAPEMLLSVNAAKLLGITADNFAGRRFEIAGRLVELVGLMDDEALTKARDLSEVPLLPMLTPASQKTSASTADAATDASGGASFAPGVQMARPTDVVFVSIDFARSLGTADFRTLSVKFDKTEGENTPSMQAWKAANSLIQFQSARVFVGLSQAVPMGDTGQRIEPGQYAVASSSATQVGGVLKIAIPIILAATIILNTMLGSVMERRREVSIYNAIGLNPGHVMMFFLAESFVFGVVGSVAGYLVGQILSLVVTRFIPTLNLNYSSLSVMVVIFLTIATVLLSTVYPAMMAARAAVPSGQRRWSLPQPEGDQIQINFPFSYDSERVLGVCAYLRDYMKQNSEASTGKFLARIGPAGLVPMTDGHGERAYAMLFDIAPAPFDLGVNQTMEVYAYYDQRIKAHMLSVHLTRVSGETSNWVTVNQPFLEALRKRLLGWRSQKATTHESYFREGEQLFAGAPDLPVLGQGSKAGSRQERA